MNITAGKCAECGSLVLMKDNGDRWRQCDGHEQAGITVDIASTLVSVGGVKA